MTQGNHRVIVGAAEGTRRLPSYVSRYKTQFKPPFSNLSTTTTMASQASRFDLPGFKLPLNFTLKRDYNSPRLFPNALDYNDIEGGYVG